jgi:hypothetical protein
MGGGRWWEKTKGGMRQEGLLLFFGRPIFFAVRGWVYGFMVGCFLDEGKAVI